MTANSRFRPRPSTSRSRPRAPHRVRRGALVAIAASLAVLAFGASASRADTGSVYFDSNENVGAGRGFFGGTPPSGFDNVGLGPSVMPSLTTGDDNIAIGLQALFSNATGGSNLAIGSDALFNNTDGDDNVATGFQALSANTTGTDNIAAGANTLNDNTTGDQNLALGKGALTNSTGADENVALGHHALFANTAGEVNTALGFGALNSNTTGANNLALGAIAGTNLTSGGDNVDIASPGQAADARTIRIGTPGNQNRAFLQGVSGTAISGPATRVLINANGQLGTAKAPTGRHGSGAAKAGDRVLSRLQARVRHLARQNQRQERELRELRARG